MVEILDSKYITCKKNGLQLHCDKTRKVVSLFLFVVHCFCLFGVFIFIWYLKIKIRNLMEQNSLLLQCFCKENININISKEK